MIKQADGAEHMTFVTFEKCRACREFGGTDLVRTDVVHADGTVDSHVRGTVDGEFVNEYSRWRARGPLDLDRVAAAREAQGWHRTA